jgi:hypothetical protein
MDKTPTTTAAATELEKTMLVDIAHDTYQPTNGGTPKTFDDTSAVWAQHLDSSIPLRQRPGVISSLSKKGWVTCQHTGKDATITLTREGFAMFQRVHAAALITAVAGVAPVAAKPAAPAASAERLSGDLHSAAHHLAVYEMIARMMPFDAPESLAQELRTASIAARDAVRAARAAIESAVKGS